MELWVTLLTVTSTTLEFLFPISTALVLVNWESYSLRKGYIHEVRQFSYIQLESMPLAILGFPRHWSDRPW